MQVIGFNISGVSAKRVEDFKQSSINTNIEFTEVKKEEVPLLKDGEAVRLDFKFSITYDEQESKENQEAEKEKPKDEPKEKNGSPSNNQAEVSLKGHIALTVTKEESDKFQESWKDKKVPQSTLVPLYNILLRKCSIKALELEDLLNLPYHIAFPRLEPQKKDN